MIDLSDTMQTEADRLTADDLMVSPTIITVIKTVKYKTEKGKPAFYLNYENDSGKPFKPCLGMRKMIIACWGKDGDKFIGRSLQLYRDPEAVFAGKKVGGVRISHASHIDKPVTLCIAINRKNKVNFTVQPLKAEQEPIQRDLKTEAETAALNGTAALLAFWETLTTPEKTILKPDMGAIKMVAAGNDPIKEEEKENAE